MKDDGVSAGIGAIILISIAVISMGIIVLAFFAGPLPINVPSFHGIVSNSSKTVYISHEGGDTLYLGRFKVLVNGNDTTSSFTQSITGDFSVGKVMCATLAYWPSNVVVVFNSSWGGETVLLSADLYGSLNLPPPGWFSSSWYNRKKIIIKGSKVTGSLTDFPVLIYTGSDTNLQNEAQAGGNDILFTSWDGTTKLPHEIDNYTGIQSGSLLAWVKVPSLTAGTDTIIYMYYNNSDASNQQDPANVWTNGYRGVWHLNNAFTDSTSNGNNGANTGSTDAAGKVYRGRSFDGNDYITITGLLG
ncbi:MAG TPA: DUF2341 domain-containing protein, partial [Methanomicrobiales archaeon]|nr:DUF2341 domain-containing protein [Methanomicrobiales archaeon]